MLTVDSKKVVIKGGLQDCFFFQVEDMIFLVILSPWHPQEEKENLIRAKTVLAGMWSKKDRRISRLLDC